MTPLVSIIVPCYNQAPYLPDALQSIIGQEYKNWECIIINDGSTDNSEEVALEWIKKDKRFKYFFKENSGVSDTRNFGIKNSTGKYILPLDGDDKISSSYLQKAVEILEADPEVKIVYSNLILFGVKNEKRIFPPYKFENMYIENQISNSSVFRRKDFPESGYNVNMKEGLEDWDFWLHFLDKETKVVKLDGFHLFYRIKEISRSTLIDHQKNERLLIQIFKNHQDVYLKYFNPIRDHIEADHFKREALWIKKQPEWLIGSIICVPFRLIKKAVTRLLK